MKQYFSIGEMAKLNYISTHTLRYYDEINLLKPSYIDEKTGYRYYSYNDFLFLDTIQYLKQFNMPLMDIKKHFENRSIENTLKVCRNQIIRLEEQMDMLMSIQSRVLHNIKNLEESSDIFKNNKQEITSFPERYAVLIEDSVSTDEEYEVEIRKLSHELYSANFRLMGDFISIKSREDINEKNFDTTIAIGNMQKSRPSNRAHKIIEPGEYACMYHLGDSADIGETYTKLIDFIRSSHYEIAGDALEIYIIDLIDTKNQDEYITHIEIPVKNLE